MDARVTTATLLSSAHGCKRPMLLVHGFLATPRVVGWLAGRLSRLGYCPHGVDLGGLFGRFNARPVEELAGVVADRVEQLAREHRRERIDLVGHSEGGLIGRYYIQKLDGTRRVRHLEQYCRILGPRSLLETTMSRIAPLVSAERTLAIINRDHLAIARPQLRSLDER